MEPTLPDWRMIGGAPGTSEPRPGTSTGPQVLVAHRLIWLGGAFVTALVLGALLTLLVMPTSGGVLIDTQAADDPGVTDAIGPTQRRLATGSGAVTAAPVRLVVDVEGAVARPGVVRVPPGGRVGDALGLAGGFAPNVDLAAAAVSLNLAQEVTDGLKIMVPAIGDVPVDIGSLPATPVGQDEGGLVDLNRASESELDGLPGVGPATIAKIMAARDEAPFRSVDELRTRGIVGDAVLGGLRDLVTTGR